MNAKKILFPTDFSTLSHAALPYAVSLARDSGATLLIVHVQEPPAVYGNGEIGFGIVEPDTAVLRTMLAAVTPKDDAVPFEHRLLFGNPAEEIVQLAENEREGVDMIVIATHGHTGLKHFLMGSVAEAVVRRANCPVLTFKPKHSTAVSTARPQVHPAADRAPTGNGEHAVGGGSAVASREAQTICSIDRLATLRVADVMHKDVATISADQSMAEAAAALVRHEISGAPVVDVAGRCVGVLTTTDFVRRDQDPGHVARQSSAAKGGVAISGDLVSDWMSPSLQSIRGDAGLLSAANKMCAAHLHRLIVVGAEGQPIGVLTTIDLVAAMANAIDEARANAPAN